MNLYFVLTMLAPLWTVMVLGQQTPYLSYVDGSEQHEPGTVFKHYHFVINMYFDRSVYHLRPSREGK